MTEPPPVVAVVGATATGKSGLALDLAERLDGEVVNADAMQLYRGMDIGTAKLPPDQRRGVPHHQLDVLEVTDEASVAAYQAAARANIAAIRSRGHRPILVGGSGLYVRAALDVLSIPPTDPAVRQRIDQQADEVGSEGMHQLLRRVDAAAAARIQPRNLRRIVRALEVIELTGQPFSASMPRREFVTPTVLLGLSVPRQILDERIDVRAAVMFREGLLAEVDGLLGRGLRAGFTASRAIGYSQALAVLDGDLSEADAVADTARATRRYARRQESWLRPDPRVRWVDAAAEDPLDTALAVLT